MISEMLDLNAYQKALNWIKGPIEDRDKSIIKDWIKNDLNILNESFYKDLEFGTGGLRGIMRLGSNGINKYTLGLATQGLANYLKLKIPKKPRVVIAYDSRNNSSFFAKTVADILKANNIDVFLFSELRPTPQLSYAVRSLSCDAGIVITASHNPKEYNGLKFYWSDGGQLVPPQDKGILSSVRKVDLSDIKWTKGNGIINYLDSKIDGSYLEKVAELSFNSKINSNLKLVFTSLHGTAITLLPKALESFGFKNVHILESQAIIDGDFPTIKSPNPEEAEALMLAVEKAEEINADMVIGCDPDADRVGIAVRNNKNKLILLNGNQTAAVLFDYVLSQKKTNKTLYENSYVATTVVTSTLLEDIANSYDVSTYITLTGFKWIGDLIARLEADKQFIIGGEESYGYLIGDFVRDKDAISASALIAESAAWYLSKGSSFYKQLLNIYAKHKLHHESLFSVTKKGRVGAEEIEQIMNRLRNNPPKKIGNTVIEKILDFQTRSSTILATGLVEKIELPRSNVIQFQMLNGDRITARPSGTEPKIKYYFSAKGDYLNLEEVDSYDRMCDTLKERIESYKTIVTNF
mgnify:CR=1 FL=1